MHVEAFFDPTTSTLSYVVYDAATRDAVVIDPVLDFDPTWVTVSEASIERILAFVREHQLDVHYVLDTHVHADHLSGFQRLQGRSWARRSGIGEAHLHGAGHVRSRASSTGSDEFTHRWQPVRRARPRRRAPLQSRGR